MNDCAKKSAAGILQTYNNNIFVLINQTLSLMFSEELEAVMSVFCLPGECFVDGTEVTVNVKIRDNGSSVCSMPEVKVVLSLGPNYPMQVPDISVLSAHLNRELVTDLKSEVTTFATELIGQPMVISLVTWIHEYLASKSEDIFEDNKIKTESDKMEIRTCLLHIDHMRAKIKYCKILEKWAHDMSLAGRILFYKRLILVVVQGSADNLKKFIVHLRNEHVDIDSRGHGCKERMMTILCDEVADINSYTDFQIRELSTVSELEAAFAAAGLGHLYTAHVQTLKCLVNDS